MGIVMAKGIYGLFVIYRLTPYVCGVHMNSPHNPHHAGASGGTDINNIDTSPPEEKYILYGK